MYYQFKLVIVISSFNYHCYFDLFRAYFVSVLNEINKVILERTTVGIGLNDLWGLSVVALNVQQINCNWFGVLIFPLTSLQIQVA